MEARIAKLESDVGHIQGDVSEMKADIREIKKDSKQDFRVVFGAIITTFLIICAALTTGYFRLSDRIDSVSTKTEGAFNQILERLPARKP